MDFCSGLIKAKVAEQRWRDRGLAPLASYEKELA